mgnify:CR=1 FL=1
MHEASRWIAAKTVIGGKQMTFEDLEPKNVTRKPVDLSTWNIGDFRDCIENMKAEIQRTKEAKRMGMGTMSMGIGA